MRSECAFTAVMLMGPWPKSSCTGHRFARRPVQSSRETISPSSLLQSPLITSNSNGKVQPWRTLTSTKSQPALADELQTMDGMPKVASNLVSTAGAHDEKSDVSFEQGCAGPPISPMTQLKPWSSQPILGQYFTRAKPSNSTSVRV